MEIKCPKCNGAGAIRYANGVEIVCECPAGKAAIVPATNEPPPTRKIKTKRTPLEKIEDKAHGWLDVVEGLLGTGEEDEEEEEEYEYE